MRLKWRVGVVRLGLRVGGGLEAEHGVGLGSRVSVARQLG